MRSDDAAEVDLRRLRDERTGADASDKLPRLVELPDEVLHRRVLRETLSALGSSRDVDSVEIGLRG